MNIDKITKLIEEIKEEIGSEAMEITINHNVRQSGWADNEPNGVIDGVYMRRGLFFESFARDECTILEGVLDKTFRYVTQKANGVIFYTGEIVRDDK